MYVDTAAFQCYWLILYSTFKKSILDERLYVSNKVLPIFMYVALADEVSIWKLRYLSELAGKFILFLIANLMSCNCDMRMLGICNLLRRFTNSSPHTVIQVNIHVGWKNLLSLYLWGFFFISSFILSNYFFVNFFSFLN